MYDARLALCLRLFVYIYTLSASCFFYFTPTQHQHPRAGRWSEKETATKWPFGYLARSTTTTAREGLLLLRSLQARRFSNPDRRPDQEHPRPSNSIRKSAKFVSQRWLCFLGLETRGGLVFCVWFIHGVGRLRTHSGSPSRTY